MWKRPVSIAIATFASFIPATGATVFSVAGPDPVSLVATLDAFRSDIGGALNPNLPVSFDSGRREVNWDGVPAGATDPNPFPGDFFNGSTPGRARGILFSTPGTSLLVSITAGGGDFGPFSPQRIFSPVDSIYTDVEFRSPADQTTLALTSAFGVIFLGVNEAESAGLEFFSAANKSLGKYFAPSTTGDASFSFLGVTFDSSSVARVRITSGSPTDTVKMDDFLFGEPSPVPEPATGAMLTAAAGILFLVRRIKRQA